MLVSEIVEQYGVTRQAVGLALRNGSLRGHKRGQFWFVETASVKEYFAETGGNPGRPKGKKDGYKRSRRKQGEEA